MAAEQTQSSAPASSAVPTLLGILVAIAVAAALHVTAGVVLPLVLAVFLSFMLSPVMSWLARKRVPEFLTLPLTLVLLVGCAVVLQLFIVQTIGEIGERLPFYESRMFEVSASLVAMLGDQANVITDVNWVQEVSGAASGLVVTLFGSLINFVANLVLVVTYTIFILLGRKALTANVSRAFSADRQDEIREIILKASQQIQRYVASKILLSAGTGILMFLILTAFGVDFAIFWGLLGFLLNFIPTVGSAIAALMPIALSLLQFLDPSKTLIIAVLLIGVHQIVGNALEPMVMGKRLNLSPIVVLFSLVFFGWLWGFWGMVLSTPLAVVLKIAFEHNKTLKPLAILLEK
jgi:predicted PurR-regulated permease PerM